MDEKTADNYRKYAGRLSCLDMCGKLNLMGGADPFLLHAAADYLVALANNAVPKKPLLPIAA